MGALDQDSRKERLFVSGGAKWGKLFKFWPDLAEPTKGIPLEEPPSAAKDLAGQCFRFGALSGKKHLTTPDGRYLIVRDRLWRCADPTIPWEVRQSLVKELMKARRAVAMARTAPEVQRARAGVNAAKQQLGERGPVWWMDGDPDLTGKMVQNTAYADWFELQKEERNQVPSDPLSLPNGEP